MKDLQLILTEDGSHSLFNPKINETYHSIHGAIQESKHVFIKAGLEHWLNTNPKGVVRIFEIGFGTGLNAFLTAVYPFISIQKVFYKSAETHPVDSSILVQLNYPQQLGSNDIFVDIHKAPWNQAVVISSSFTLYKHKTDLTADILHDETHYDIIYYDAFGPSKQPEMWSKELLSKVVSLIGEKGIFVTYCAKGQVKRDLKSLGLYVETLDGPPGKLQMIRATRQAALS